MTPQTSFVSYTPFMENNNFARGVNYRKLSEKYISLPFLLCLSPLVFLFLGVIISRSPNHRPELIEMCALCFLLILGITVERRLGLWRNTIF